MQYEKSMPLSGIQKSFRIISLAFVIFSFIALLFAEKYFVSNEFVLFILFGGIIMVTTAKGYNKKVLVIAGVIITLLIAFFFGYQFLVKNGIVTSFQNLSSAKEIKHLRAGYKKSDAVYINEPYGFKFYYDDYNINDENEVIKTSFTKPNIAIDVYYENFEDTIHNTNTYTHYGNRSIVSDDYVTVSKNYFTKESKRKLHIIQWSRKGLSKVKNDLNHYASIDIIMNEHEVYTIYVRSSETVNIEDVIARIDFIEKDTSQPLNQLTVVRQENQQWNESTRRYYKVKFVEADHVDWGIFEPTSIRALENLHTIEKAVDHDFSTLLQYYDLQFDIPFENLAEIYDEGKYLEFTFQSTVHGAYDPSITLKVLDGVYDEELRDMVRKIKSLDKPIMFRLNNEMNGDWCFYNAFHYQKDTSLYLALWQYFYELFESEDVSNVIWVWNPNEKSFPGFKWNDHTNYFPGEGYVDIIGVTGYNTGDFYEGETWREFESIYDEFMPGYKSTFQDYPFMITEFGSSTFGGDKATWVKNMLKVIDKYDFKLAIYWNSIDYTPTYEKARVYKFDDDDVIVRLFKDYFN